MATAGTEARPTDFSQFRVSQGLMNYCLGTSMDAKLRFATANGRHYPGLPDKVPKQSLGHKAVPQKELGNENNVTWEAA